MVATFTHTQELVTSLCFQLNNQLLQRWYPFVVDKECGGYFTNVMNNWNLVPEQDKMIVSQARHVWTTSKAASFVSHGEEYGAIAEHGLLFLRDFMWDEKCGGFFQIRSRSGGYTETYGWRDEKRTHGNASSIHALAALYRLTRNQPVLDFAKEAFHWIEEHAYDREYGGYFQCLTREGEPFDRTGRCASIARDKNEIGYKNQHSSIQLLGAYTELYQVWKDKTLHKQLASLLHLIRDTMVTHRGYLQHFYSRDWQPLTFRNASLEDRVRNYDLDHVSFGHDYETAVLLLEASYALGIDHDSRTLAIAQRMLEHAIAYGWDRHRGGFYEGGLYLDESDQCAIIRKTKPWWGQAEALNTLLLFSRIFPHDSSYRELFEQEWEYIDKHVLDHHHGDWFEEGLDMAPHLRTGYKSHMWKCTYHTGRALMNSIALLLDEERAGPGVRERKLALEKFIQHWKSA
jgi:cellobiose epimerase